MKTTEESTGSESVKETLHETATEATPAAGRRARERGARRDGARRRGGQRGRRRRAGVRGKRGRQGAGRRDERRRARGRSGRREGAGRPQGARRREGRPPRRPSATRRRPQRSPPPRRPAAKRRPPRRAPASALRRQERRARRRGAVRDGDRGARHRGAGSPRATRATSRAARPSSSAATASAPAATAAVATAAVAAVASARAATAAVAAVAAARRRARAARAASRSRRRSTRSASSTCCPTASAFCARSGFVQSDDDVYVSLSQIRRFGLRRGDEIAGQVREPKDNEKYNALLKVDTVNGVDPDTARQRPLFEKLTPLFPDERLRLETPEHDTAARIMDLLCPIGKGQRGLIVSPPKAGKTTILKKLANSITANHPEVKLIVLLVDERPEEVTDMQRSVNGTVVASTFDQPSENHVQVTELVLDRVKRLVEIGDDVVVLLDSITRMARAFNLNTPASGPHPLGRRRLHRAVSAQEVLRRGPQHRVRRLAHHPGHGAGRHRLAHGRGHLRGVQGHRQHGDPPRPQAGRQAHLPGDRHRLDRHPQRGAPHGARRSGHGLEAARRAALARALGRHRAAHQQGARRPSPTRSSCCRSRRTRAKRTMPAVAPGAARRPARPRRHVARRRRATGRRLVLRREQ